LDLFIYLSQKKSMRHLISFFLVCVSLQLHAQKTTYTEPVLTATFLSPGITYEHPVANKLTLKGKAAFIVGWSFSASSALGQSYSLAPTALAAGQFRYYYNFGLRKTREKNIAHNSANYISFLARYGYSGVTYHYGDQGNYSIKQASHMPDFGIVWGIQRNYKNRFSIDCSAGPSLYEPLANNEFTLLADISLGIWLGRKHDH
jgi:hypothetical protein